MGNHELHIVLFLVMAHGHTIPILDMAKLFNSKGLKTTIISTPAFADPITKAQQSGLDIGLSIIQFPPEGSSLPDNIIISLDQMTTPDLIPRFVKALALLQEPVEKLLKQLNPNCLVSDMFFPWTANCAAKFGFPRFVFHGTSYFARCCDEKMKLHKPFKNVSYDSEPFVLPNLPHQLHFVRTQVSEFELEEKENKNDFVMLLDQMRESESRSYGVTVNSFYELESDYADHYKHVMGRKAWHIGPLLFSNDNSFSRRGKKLAIDEHECLVWLDSKRPNSVVYVCFGSIATFTSVQLHETAIGLESSGQDFIWV